MVQDTTEEFAHRFNRAVDGHPLASPTPHGRQSWVMGKLENEVGLKVSANTLSKWFKGMARPRPDNVRLIARVLKVEEVWLAMGRKPADQAASIQGAERARGAVLMVAGLVEMSGGRVTFASPEAAPVDLQVNLEGNQFNAVIVSLTEQGKTASCVVPEPVGDSRIIAVVRHETDNCTSCIQLYDLTNIPRESLGGFSVMQLEIRKDARFKAPGVKNL